MKPGTKCHSCGKPAVHEYIDPNGDETPMPECAACKAAGEEGLIFEGQEEEMACACQECREKRSGQDAEKLHGPLAHELLFPKVDSPNHDWVVRVRSSLTEKQQYLLLRLADIVRAEANNLVSKSQEQ
jgi:hypothetical protein